MIVEAKSWFRSNHLSILSYVLIFNLKKNTFLGVFNLKINLNSNKYSKLKTSLIYLVSIRVCIMKLVEFYSKGDGTTRHSRTNTLKCGILPVLLSAI